MVIIRCYLILEGQATVGRAVCGAQSDFLTHET
jgi:hypothetical protein